MRSILSKFGKGNIKTKEEEEYAAKQQIEIEEKKRRAEIDLAQKKEMQKKENNFTVDGVHFIKMRHNDLLLLQNIDNYKGRSFYEKKANTDSTPVKLGILTDIFVEKEDTNKDNWGRIYRAEILVFNDNGKTNYRFIFRYDAREGYQRYLHENPHVKTAFVERFGNSDSGAQEIIDAMVYDFSVNSTKYNLYVDQKFFYASDLGKYKDNQIYGPTGLIGTYKGFKTDDPFTYSKFIKDGNEIEINDNELPQMSLEPFPPSSSTNGGKRSSRRKSVSRRKRNNRRKSKKNMKKSRK